MRSKQAFYLGGRRLDPRHNYALLQHIMVNKENCLRHLPSWVDRIENVEFGWLWCLFYFGANKSDYFYIYSKYAVCLKDVSVDMISLLRVRQEVPLGKSSCITSVKNAMSLWIMAFHEMDRGVSTLKTLCSLFGETLTDRTFWSLHFCRHSM